MVEFALFTTTPKINTAIANSKTGTKKKPLQPTTTNIKVRHPITINTKPLNKLGKDNTVGFCDQRQTLLLLVLFNCYTKKYAYRTLKNPCSMRFYTNCVSDSDRFLFLKLWY